MDYSPRMVLFDLDGTLADTAPDMIRAVNRLRAEVDLEPVPEHTLRPLVSRGGAAMVRAGFPEFREAESMFLDRFLGMYSDRVAELTELFPGMAEVLRLLELKGRLWGVVTNKPGWLARPVLAGLRLERRCSVLVAGDTLAKRKPEPDPILHALGAFGMKPHNGIMIGDDRRDIESARAAGVKSVLARWGYIPDDETPDDWGADIACDRPLDLLAVLGLAG